MGSSWKTLISIFIFFSSCSGWGGEEEIKFGQATSDVIKATKAQYGFKEIKMIRFTKPEFLNEIVIQCEDGKNLPVEHLTLNRLMNNIASTILASLDNELKIEIVHVNFTTNFKDRSIFEPQSRTTSMSFRLVNGKLIDNL